MCWGLILEAHTCGRRRVEELSESEAGREGTCPAIYRCLLAPRWGRCEGPAPGGIHPSRLNSRAHVSLLPRPPPGRRGAESQCSDGRALGRLPALPEGCVPQEKQCFLSIFSSPFPVQRVRTSSDVLIGCGNNVHVPFIFIATFPSFSFSLSFSNWPWFRLVLTIAGRGILPTGLVCLGVGCVGLGSGLSLFCAFSLHPSDRILLLFSRSLSLLLQSCRLLPLHRYPLGLLNTLHFFPLSSPFPFL